MTPSMLAGLAENARRRAPDAVAVRGGQGVPVPARRPPTPRDRARDRRHRAIRGVGARHRRCRDAPCRRRPATSRADADVATLKGLVDALHDALGAPRPAYRRRDAGDELHPHRHPGRTARHPRRRRPRVRHPRRGAPARRRGMGPAGRPVDASINLGRLLALVPDEALDAGPGRPAGRSRPGGRASTRPRRSVSCCAIARTSGRARCWSSCGSSTSTAASRSARARVSYAIALPLPARRGRRREGGRQGDEPGPRLAAAPPRRRDPLSAVVIALSPSRGAATLAAARAWHSRARAPCQQEDPKVELLSQLSWIDLAIIVVPGRRRLRRLHAGHDPLPPELRRRARRVRARLAPDGARSSTCSASGRRSRPRAASCSSSTVLFFGLRDRGWFVIRARLPAHAGCRSRSSSTRSAARSSGCSSSRWSSAFRLVVLDSFFFEGGERRPAAGWPALLRRAERIGHRRLLPRARASDRRLHPPPVRPERHRRALPLP